MRAPNHHCNSYTNAPETVKYPVLVSAFQYLIFLLKCRFPSCYLNNNGHKVKRLPVTLYQFNHFDSRLKNNFRLYRIGYQAGCFRFFQDTDRFFFICIGGNG